MMSLYRCAKRLTHAVLATAALHPCLAVAATTVGARLPTGEYRAGPSRLELLGSGQFRYTGGQSCFRGYSDVGIRDEFSGRYRLSGDWLVLEPEGFGSFIEGCSIDPRLYVLKVDGRTVLMTEGYLRFIVNQRRSGRPTDKFYPYHRQGEPAEFSKDPEAWLPAPYAGLFRMPPRAAKVVEVGEAATETVFGSGGRQEGQQARARLKIDIGRRDGAFKGMRVCSPGSPVAVELQSVEEDSATLTWSWRLPDGAAAQIGMTLTGYCP